MFKVRQAKPDDYPFLANLTGNPIPRWFEWDRQDVIYVVEQEGRILGCMVVTFDPEASTYILKYLFVMKYFRRNGIARAMWGTAFMQLIPGHWVAHVGEQFTDAQCCLRSFGFRCVGTNADGSLRFVRGE